MTSAGIVFRAPSCSAGGPPWNVLLRPRSASSSGGQPRRALRLLSGRRPGPRSPTTTGRAVRRQYRRVALCRALLHEPHGADGTARCVDPLACSSVVLINSIVSSSPTGSWIYAPRPARIAADIPIELDRPRHIADRRSDAFRDYVTAIRDEFSPGGLQR
ncbi:hypothetical protein HBB16_07170 [Pseudonocardia sp. MCCB 268]|nr:hypothetical protein [Pseudonocardia cytotoxica]